MATSLTKDPKFTNLFLLLELIRHHELICKKWLGMRGKTKQSLAFEDALQAAKWAMHDQITEYIHTARERGQLLFCFEGTTVLQGGAA